MRGRTLRCNRTRLPGAVARWHPGQQVTCGGQAAIGFPAIGNWLRAGIATPALTSAATRFVSSGWDDISSARLIQKLWSFSACAANSRTSTWGVKLFARGQGQQAADRALRLAGGADPIAGVLTGA